MTKDQAKALYESGWWNDLTAREIAGFQLFEPLLCVPFGVFHKAVEESLGRPVYTHEFGLALDGLKREFLGDRPAPTLEEIINLIPADKRVVLISGEG